MAFVARSRRSVSTRSASYRLIWSGSVIVRQTTSTGASITTSRSISKFAMTLPWPLYLQPKVAHQEGHATFCCMSLPVAGAASRPMRADRSAGLEGPDKWG
jgi:hypothetical protein